MELTIRLYNSDAAIRKTTAASPSSVSSDDGEDRVAPFTASPLDSSRGSTKQNSRPRVRDAAKKKNAKAKAPA